MNIPPPTIIRDFLFDPDQTVDEPFHRPFDFFAHGVELPEDMKEDVGDDPARATDLGRSEALASRLISAQGIGGNLGSLKIDHD